MTRFFKFPGETDALNLLPAAFVRRGDGGEPLPDGMTALAFTPHPLVRGGRWEAGDGGPVQVEAPTALAGFHVNVLGEVPEGWAAFEVFPVNPVVVFPS